MNQTELETKVKTLSETIAKLETRLTRNEDIEAIKKLQRAYGYYLEHWQEEELIGLFSHSPDVTVEINDIGEFKGWEGVQSCFHFRRPLSRLWSSEKGSSRISTYTDADCGYCRFGPGRQDMLKGDGMVSSSGLCPERDKPEH